MLIGQSNRYNTLGLSLGTSFADPLIIGTVNVTMSPVKYMFLDFGFDIGALSVYEDVQSYYSVYPFFNLGLFLPFQGKGGFYLSAGFGYLKGSYTFDYGSVSLDLVACNFTAGLNIGNVFNLSYTLRTDFNSVGGKLSIGYVIRIE